MKASTFEKGLYRSFLISAFICAFAWLYEFETIKNIFATYMMLAGGTWAFLFAED